MIFYQLFEPESCTYTYLLGDEASKEAVIIDPVKETVERDLKLIIDLGLRLKYILETHVHADHITGASLIKKDTQAQIAVSVKSDVKCPDLKIQDGQVLEFGKYKILCVATPGHTSGCTSYFVDNKVFTGDTLLIRSAGRTDFQDGDSRALYKSVHEKLFILPDSTEVYPAHDYKGLSKSTIGLEKKLNPRLGLDKSEDDFVKIMSDLKLAYPKKIDVALPANLMCGEENVQN